MSSNFSNLRNFPKSPAIQHMEIKNQVLKSSPDINGVHYLRKTEERLQKRILSNQCNYLILIQSNLAVPGPGFFHWEGISEIK
jgi:hypothetical protein